MEEFSRQLLFLQWYYTWDIYLEKCSKGYIAVGVAKSEVNADEFLGRLLCWSFVVPLHDRLGSGFDQYGWGLFLQERSRYHNRTKTQGGAPYGTVPFKPGDLLTLILDSDRGTLSFACNGKDLGCALSPFLHILNSFLQFHCIIKEILFLFVINGLHSWVLLWNRWSASQSYLSFFAGLKFVIVVGFLQKSKQSTIVSSIVGASELLRVLDSSSSNSCSLSTFCDLSSSSLFSSASSSSSSFSFPSYQFPRFLTCDCGFVAFALEKLYAFWQFWHNSSTRAIRSQSGTIAKVDVSSDACNAVFGFAAGDKIRLPKGEARVLGASATGLPEYCFLLTCGAHFFYAVLLLRSRWFDHQL